MPFCLLTFNHLPLSRHRAVACHGHIPWAALSLARRCPACGNAHFPAGCALGGCRLPAGCWTELGLCCSSVLRTFRGTSQPSLPETRAFFRQARQPLLPTDAPGASGPASGAPRLGKTPRGMGTGAPDVPGVKLLKKKKNKKE